MKHFVDLQSNTHFTTITLMNDFRRQIKEKDLELEHAQKVADSLRHTIRETKKQDHLDDLRQIINEEDGGWCKKVDLLYTHGIPVHHRFRNKIKQKVGHYVKPKNGIAPKYLRNVYDMIVPQDNRGLRIKLGMAK